MNPKKPRKCKHCREPYTPSKPMQTACSIPCALALAKKAKEKAQAVKAKEERKADRARKEKLKTRSDYIKDAQRVANRYARVRDIASGYGCISCGEPYRGGYGGAFDGGHFRSTGSAPHLRLDLRNINLQCVKCNRYLASNAVEYRKNLIARIGVDSVERLERDQASRLWSVEYLKRYKVVIGKRLRRMEGRM